MKEVLEEAINSHYMAKDYTEVVRDSLLCLMNEIRKKTDLVDNDGVDLINKAFSESNPLIRINKLENSTDKNKHRGIMDLSKGLIEYFRNPMSHSKQEYPKEVAEAILILLDKVILEEIVGSKSINSIDEWYLEIVNDLSPNTERYAKNLVLNIPNSKHLELSIMLYRNRNMIKKSKDKIINELANNLAPDEYKEYCGMIENDLFGSIKEDSLISSLKSITPSVWDSFTSLTKSKIEDIVFEDISNYRMFYKTDAFGEYDGIGQESGYLLENSLHIVRNFSNLKEIINKIVERIDDKDEIDESASYLINTYSELIVFNDTYVNYSFMAYVAEKSLYKKKPEWFFKLKHIVENLPVDSKWFKLLSNSLGISSNDSSADAVYLKLDDVADLPF